MAHLAPPAAQDELARKLRIGDDEAVAFQNWLLPAVEFDGLWETLVFEEEIKGRLLRYVSTAMRFAELGVDGNVIAWNRVVLLHGPPGTGKTLVAKRLAKASRLEYALMSGGDVGPLGSDGVTALHTLFRWARTSETGVLVFIDEAEAFLASRSRAKLTEHMRNALNAFLYQTGSPTTSFVLVLATNRAEDLDEAVLDRGREREAMEWVAERR